MKLLVTIPRRSALLASVLTLAAAGAILVPIRVVAQAPEDGRSQEERRDTRKPASTPARDVDAVDRSVKVREAERSDPAAAARVATPRSSRDPQTASPDIVTRRVYLDTRGVVPDDRERRAASTVREVDRQETRLERRSGTDGRRLQDLEKRLRALERELQRAADLNRKLDEERRVLERELRGLRLRGGVINEERDRSDDRATTGSPRYRTEERRVIIREPRDSRGRDPRSERGEERGDPAMPTEPLSRLPRDDSRPGERGDRALPTEPLSRLPRRDPQTRERGDRAIPTDPSAQPSPRDNYRTKPSDPNRRSDSDPKTTPRRDDGSRRTPEEAALQLGRTPRDLSLRMLRGAADGERVLSTSRTTVLAGEWAVFETPTGRQLARSGDADGGQSIRLRLIEGRQRGELFLQVGLSDEPDPELISVRPGQTLKVVKDSGAGAKPVLIEIQVLSPGPGSR